MHTIIDNAVSFEILVRLSSECGWNNESRGSYYQLKHECSAKALRKRFAIL